MTPDDFPVFPAPFHTGLVTPRLFATWDFYTEHLGFRTVHERRGCVQLFHPGGARLTLLQEEAGIAPAELVSATDGRGVWLTLEVADAGTERARLQAAGLATEALPENGPWPQAAFAVSDPNGVLVIITPRAGPPARMLPALATAVG
jgi:catechol 2,3-dioxygenase-like lactoylglutathione lyase family enzyme